MVHCDVAPTTGGFVADTPYNMIENGLNQHKTADPINVLDDL